eukprot:3117048-Amphidinium_carterae.1
MLGLAPAWHVCTVGIWTGRQRWLPLKPQKSGAASWYPQLQAAWIKFAIHLPAPSVEQNKLAIKRRKS